jgi:hypothetical protein
VIMRVWHGVTPEEKGDAYYAYILETGVTKPGEI